MSNLNDEQKKLLNILMNRSNVSYLDSCGGAVRFSDNDSKIAEFINIDQFGNLVFDENKRLEKEFAKYYQQDIPSNWFNKYFDFSNGQHKLNDNFLACIIRNPLMIRSNVQKEPITAIGYISNKSGKEEIYALIVLLNNEDGFYLLPNIKPNGNNNYFSRHIRDLEYRNLHLNDYFVFRYYPLQIDNKLIKFAISSTMNYLINKKQSFTDKNIIRKYKNEIFILEKILSDIVKIEQSPLSFIINFDNKINNLTEFNQSDLDTIYCLENIFKIIIQTAIRVTINNS